MDEKAIDLEDSEIITAYPDDGRAQSEEFMLGDLLKITSSKV